MHCNLTDLFLYRSSNNYSEEAGHAWGRYFSIITANPTISYSTLSLSIRTNDKTQFQGKLWTILVSSSILTKWRWYHWWWWHPILRCQPLLLLLGTRLGTWTFYYYSTRSQKPLLAGACSLPTLLNWHIFLGKYKKVTCMKNTASKFGSISSASLNTRTVEQAHTPKINISILHWSKNWTDIIFNL